MPNGFQDYLLGLPKEEFDSLYQKFTAAKPEPFSGARKKTYGTMGIATPQDVQFAERAKEKVAPIAQAVYEGTLADPVERLASWSALADPNTPETARKAAQDYVAPLPVTPEGRINEEGLSRAAGPIMGITTYHGTPTSGIRKWDLNFRGTGEGRLPVDSPARESFRDMIGHGLYSAEREGIAKGYQERLTEQSYHNIGERFRKEYPELRHKVVDVLGENDPTILGAFIKAVGNDTSLKPQFKGIEKELREAATKIAPKGSLYTTELTPHPAQYLAWDGKTATKQLDKLNKKLEKEMRGVGERYEALRKDKYPDASPWEVLNKSDKLLQSQRADIGMSKGDYVAYKLLNEAEWTVKPFVETNGTTRYGIYLDGYMEGTYDSEIAAINAANRFRRQRGGGNFYRRLSGELGSDKAASEYLQSKGIAGIKYLDNPSRGAGEGTYNYVMFNPAEEAIITHENGQRIPGAVEEAYRKLRDPKSKALFEKRYPELKGE